MRRVGGVSGEGVNLPPAWTGDFFEPHTHCWFGPGNVTTAGWKLGEMQDEDEGHDDGEGEDRAKDKPGIGVVMGRELFVGFVHCARI